MHISQKAEYALRAMLHLARQEPADMPRPAAAIARVEELPEKFLEQILNDLRKQGLVVSQRGADGGYRLARARKELSVGEILQAMDGPLVSELAPHTGHSGEARLTFQALREIRTRLAAGISAAVDDLTLQELCDKVEEQGAVLDFSI